MFSGSGFPMGLMRILCDQTGSGKIQDGGLLISNACIFVPRQDINEIPTAIPMFSGSSFPLGLMRILCDRTGSGQIQDGGLYISNACIYACTLDINAIPTATPMAFGSSFPTGLGRIPRAQTGSREKAISELQISMCTVLLVDQNFSYHMGVITRKQVKQSRICGTFRAFHFRFGRTSVPQVPVECWTSET